MTIPATISSTTAGSRTRGSSPSRKGAAKANLEWNLACAPPRGPT